MGGSFSVKRKFIPKGGQLRREKECINLSEHSCINLSERYRLHRHLVKHVKNFHPQHSSKQPVLSINYMRTILAIKKNTSGLAEEFLP